MESLAIERGGSESRALQTEVLLIIHESWHRMCAWATGGRSAGNHLCSWELGVGGWESLKLRCGGFWKVVPGGSGSEGSAQGCDQASGQGGRDWGAWVTPSLLGTRSESGLPALGSALAAAQLVSLLEGFVFTLGLWGWTWETNDEPGRMEMRDSRSIPPALQQAKLQPQAHLLLWLGSQSLLRELTSWAVSRGVLPGSGWRQLTPRTPVIRDWGPQKREELWVHSLWHTFCLKDGKRLGRFLGNLFL